jgi:ADP-ribose pyrophosphatase YjhB (NUDIX family)
MYNIYEVNFFIKEVFCMQDYVYCPQCAAKLIAQQVDRRLRQVCPQCHYINYRNPLPAVMALVEKNRHMLLIKRGVMPAKGLWTFPSGFMEASESPEEAVLRELQEETGVTGEITGIINAYAEHSKLYGPIVNIAYAVRPLCGEPHPGDDADGARWVNKAQIGDLAFAIFRQAFADYSQLFPPLPDRTSGHG